jgi:hypothetical protein
MHFIMIDTTHMHTHAYIQTYILKRAFIH